MLSNYRKFSESFNPETVKQFDAMTPENFAPKELKDPYDKAALDPKIWPVLVVKNQENGSRV